MTESMSAREIAEALSEGMNCLAAILVRAMPLSSHSALSPLLTAFARACTKASLVESGHDLAGAGTLARELVAQLEAGAALDSDAVLILAERILEAMGLEEPPGGWGALTSA